MNPQSPTHNFVSQVVIQDVRVLAVDLNNDLASNKPATPSTATLEVNVEDSQKLAVAADHLPERLVRGLALDVPQGDVDRRERERLAPQIRERCPIARRARVVEGVARRGPERLSPRIPPVG